MRRLDLSEMFSIRELCCGCCLPLVALRFSHYSPPGYCSQSCSISTLINIFSVCWQYNHSSWRLSIIGSISPLHTHKGCHGDLRPALWRLSWHQCLPVFCWHGDLSAPTRMKQFKFAAVEHCWMFTDSWNGSQWLTSKERRTRVRLIVRGERRGFMDMICLLKASLKWLWAPMRILKGKEQHCAEL